MEIDGLVGQCEDRLLRQRRVFQASAAHIGEAHTEQRARGHRRALIARQITRRGLVWAAPVHRSRHAANQNRLRDLRAAGAFHNGRSRARHRQRSHR